MQESLQRDLTVSRKSPACQDGLRQLSRMVSTHEHMYNIALS